MTDRELMQMALDAMLAAIKAGDWKVDGACDPDLVLHRIEARLAQCDAGEICLGCRVCPDVPPQREWQGLTDEEILEEYRQSYGDDGNLTDIYFAHAIEVKLKEKNGG